MDATRERSHSAKAVLAADALRRVASADGGGFGPIALAAEAGTIMGILGPNGAGKTSLLRALAGLLPADSGSVRVNGVPLRDLSARDRATRVAYLPQREPVMDGWTVRAWVAQARAPHTGWTGRLGRRDDAAVEEAIQSWSLAPLADREISTLSGGELRRCALARAFAQHTDVLLLDEPLSSLDLAQQVGCIDRLRRWVDGTRAVVMVLHDLSLASRWCDRLLLLRAGEAVAYGSPREVLRSETISAAFGVAVVATRDDARGVVHVDVAEG